MTYAQHRTIFDADSHLMELPDFLSRHAEPKFRSAVPAVGTGTTGTFDFQKYAQERAHAAATVETLVAMGDALIKGPKWHDALGSFNGAERGTVLDMLGFERQVVFSSFCSRMVFGEQDVALKYALARAHNRAMQEFCANDDRLIGVAMVPLDDPERALVEITAAASAGLGAVWIASEPPGGRSPGHVDHEPIWRALAERRLPFILHVGSSELSIPDPWMNDGRPSRVTARGGAEVIGSKDLTVIHHSAHRFVSVLVLDGVLERHPDLRGGVIELGAGWVPDMVRRLDHAVKIWSRSEPDLAKMQRLPSEQILAQLRFTPYPFEDVGQLVAESHPGLYMFSSDYPHAEGGRDPIGRFERSLAGLDDAVRAGFFAGNAACLYANG